MKALNKNEIMKMIEAALKGKTEDKTEDKRAARKTESRVTRNISISLNDDETNELLEALKESIKSEADDSLLDVYYFIRMHSEKRVEDYASKAARNVQKYAPVHVKTMISVLKEFGESEELVKKLKQYT